MLGDHIDRRQPGADLDLDHLAAVPADHRSDPVEDGRQLFAAADCWLQLHQNECHSSSPSRTLCTDLDCIRLYMTVLTTIVHMSSYYSRGGGQRQATGAATFYTQPVLARCR